MLKTSIKAIMVNSGLRIPLEASTHSALSTKVEKINKNNNNNQHNPRQNIIKNKRH